MAGGFRSHGGGITDLWALYEEHPEAIEHELITLGLRWRQLGTDLLSWRDLKVIITQRPASSAITRVTHPDIHLAEEQLLEGIAFLLSVGNTQRGNQSGARRDDFPKPPAWATKAETNTIGSAPIPYDEMAAWLGGDFLTL